MERVELSLVEWQAVVQELEAVHTNTPPPGLLDRARALLVQAPQAWTDQPFALELDTSSAEAVRGAHEALQRRDPHARQRSASLAEAMRIIHDHQQSS